MFRTILAATAAVALASPVLAADFQSIPSDKPVADTMDALVAAVEGAGATVFARVDHAEGAASVDMELPAAQLLIFGNPQLGTRAMQDDLRAGVMLPLRVLVYDDEGQTQVLWPEMDDMFDDLTIPDDADYVEKMKGALQTLTGKAVE
ncbi:DUF302 domain-containing protein [Jannaschia rubra]|uniref:DUF302 domain-containing protein n=1 Tax=Jannaschia rubra TaxID=282197 RepID=A0A0M6XLL3_9RHOB|nr:DUF302 domain-containing protein [Jannaschia rubra]CTQ32036.1 hypothetical protein JAN5088_00796 [Jannaschia rubra]SFG39241.1 protein of unknown function DUF302 [Jannaschia rubra]